MVKSAPRVLVIFDVDGTLTRTSDLNVRAFTRAFEDVLGAPLPSQDWSQYPRVSATGLFEDACHRVLGRDPHDEERAGIRARTIELLAIALFSLKDSLEVPGAVHAVARLTSGPHAVALATGDWRESAEIKLERAGFEIEGLPLATADDALAREDIIRLAYQRAGATTHPHVVYVGDGPWDLEAARSLGFAVVGVAPDGQDGRLREAGVQDIIRDFGDYHLFEAHLMTALERNLT